MLNVNPCAEDIDVNVFCVEAESSSREIRRIVCVNPSAEKIQMPIF
jgi:hypothetical protein